MAALGHIDALVFTGGIGEHDSLVRQRACAGLEGFGIALDERRNNSVEGECEVQGVESAVKVLVIPTNEEFEIAEQTAGCLQTKK